MSLISINRKRPAVVLDVDGVLFPCAELGVERWNKEHPDKEPMIVEEITGYGAIGKRTDEILPYYAEEDFYRAQRPYPGAREFVEKLNSLYEVYFLTAVPDNVVKYRSTQLKRYFPYVKKDHIFFGSVKERFVADFSLDDCPGHILAQYESGAVKHPVIMRRPWNEDLSGIMSVTDYDDFLTFIKLVQNIESFSEINKQQGSRIIALVGPPGSDKGNLLTQMLEFGYRRLPSYTTAAKRADEPAGYTHVSIEEFRSMKEEGKFIESTSYCKHYYAISGEGAREAMQENASYITVVDICGAVTLKRLFGARCLTVYVKRGDDAILTDLINRYVGDELKNRLRWLSAERGNRELCDITIVNDNVSLAAKALKDFI